jgi:hypothetical protein
MIPVHCVWELARFGGRQLVIQEAIWVKNGSVARCPLLSFVQDQKGGNRCIRVRIPLLVVMNVVAVHNERRVLWDVHPVIHKVFGGGVRRWYPKWWVGAHHLKEKGQLVRRRDEIAWRSSIPP